uniref:Major facilitator superfamily (MFS) profile domain-containing protein n=1 Tax=Globisporangium ultimum (strain ATCC 200006 / CBS 805.95 / DAOM BR144) TaxID=431595 RepID=K3X9U8_GLOUD
MAAQLDVLAWVCFCGPGLFNALTSFASGLDDARLAFAGNALIYACFAACSALAAALVPAMGVRAALVVGASGYFVYAAALFNVQVNGFAPLVAFMAACVAVGVSAGFLWTAQGLMIMSYPNVETRGQSVSRFWVIFNLGAAAGGVIGFVLNFPQDPDSTAAKVTRASTGMFVVFLVLMGVGVALAVCFIEDAGNVIHDSGGDDKAQPSSRGASAVAASWMQWRARLHTAWSVVVCDQSHRNVLLCLLPLFVYSNWFYTYHAFFNVTVFNARTSGLASASYWLAQMGGAYVSGRVLDHQIQKQQSQPECVNSENQNEAQCRTYGTVARVSKQFLLVFCVLANVMWGIGWLVQDSWLHLSYETSLNVDFWSQDTTESLFVLLLTLYVVYGFHDALCQVWIYWFMSMHTANDAIACSCYAGMYKCVQAASAAVAWYLGAVQVSPLTQLQVNVVLCNVGILCAWIASCKTSSPANRSGSAEPEEPDERNPLLPAINADRPPQVAVPARVYSSL